MIPSSLIFPALFSSVSPTIDPSNYASIRMRDLVRELMLYVDIHDPMERYIRYQVIL